MSKRISSCIAVIICLFSTAAYSQDLDYYVSGNVGIAMMEDATTQDSTLPGVSLDFGFESDLTFGGAFGARSGPWRSELELGYQQHDADSIRVLGLSAPLAGTGLSGQVDVLTGLVNAYYDHDIGYRLTPYVTAGVGFSRIEAELAVPGLGTFSGEDTVFAYQVGAGVGFALSETVTLDVRYRFLKSADPEFETVQSEFQSHNVLFGVRVNF